jgi:hypothetical protein
MKAVAAIFTGHDNDCYMVASCEKRLYDVPDGVFCPQCGWKKDWTYTRPDFALRKRKMDVSSTYDGATIVSERVRNVFMSEGVEDSVLVPLLCEPGFYHLVPACCVEFDVNRRGTRFGTLCPTCGLHDTVAGATPAFLKRIPVGGHIFRTDILFGSYNEHSPMIIVSASLLNALHRESFTGLELESIDAEHVAPGDASQPRA